MKQKIRTVTAMSSKKDDIEVQAKLNTIAKEYELIKKEIQKIEARGRMERDKLLTRGIEIQGAMKYVREVYGMAPTPLSREQVDTYVKKNLDGVYRETLKEFVLNNMDDNLIAVDIIEKYNLNEADKYAERQAVPDET